MYVTLLAWQESVRVNHSNTCLPIPWQNQEIGKGRKGGNSAPSVTPVVIFTAQSQAATRQMLYTEPEVLALAHRKK